MATLDAIERRLHSAQMGHSYDARAFLLTDTTQVLSELKLWREKVRVLRDQPRPLSWPLEFDAAFKELMALLEDVEKIEKRGDQ